LRNFFRRETYRPKRGLKRGGKKKYKVFHRRPVRNMTIIAADQEAPEKITVNTGLSKTGNGNGKNCACETWRMRG